MSPCSAAPWALAGSGTQDEPYQISSAADLQEFVKRVNGGNTAACAVLTADITINSNVLDEDGNLINNGSGFTPWTPIGNEYINRYTGTFDGAEHTISGLYIDSNASYVGLFGYIGTNGTVKNLNLADSSINSSSSEYYASVGGICGRNDGRIENCSNSGTVTGSDRVGGICGYNWGNITSCSNSGLITGNGDVGGICGYNWGNITSCSNSGPVTGNGGVGGICGRNTASSITSCSNSGTVTCSGTYAGGICGQNWSGSITNCSNSGIVTGSGNYLGGICGGYGGGITTCYWLEGTAGAGIGDNSGGGEATEKTADQYASGEVAWLLNGSSTNGPWRQNLTGTNRDAFPTLDPTHGVVGFSNGAYHNCTYDVNGFCTICGSYEPAVQDASGTYQISNAGQLYWFAELVNGTLTDGTAKNTAACAVLMGDINLNGTESDPWTPIGNVNNKYIGTFDGNNKTIKGLNIDSDAEYAGLFGCIGEGGRVQNLTLVDSAIRISRSESNTFVGGICGDNLGSITNCHNSGIVNVNGGASTYVGGICGRNWNKGSIESCSNSGAVSGISDVGGICGRNDGSITSCSNSGAVTGSGSDVGGICGHNDSSITTCSNSGTVTGSGNYVGGICGYNLGSIENCDNSGDVSGISDVGGICGRSDGSITTCSNSGAVTGNNVGGICGHNDGSITTCSNSGKVTGSGDYVGGICGVNDDGSIENCYWLATAYAGEGVGSGDGTVVAKNEDEYKSGEVAWRLNQWPGNDKVDGKVWAMGADGYPVLNGKSDNIVVKLTFDTNTGKEEEQPIICYGNIGDALPNVTLPEITGYTFAGWYDNEALSGDPVTEISAEATGEKTYYAKWTANVYTVTLNTNGGTINSGNITSYTYGIGATLPTDVTRSGYTFGGWYDKRSAERRTGNSDFC